MKKITIIFSLLLMAVCGFTTIINVPTDQPTIQDGINATVDGDTVLVDEGIYYENINFLGKSIVVTSYYYLSGDSTYINSTIIDGSYPSNPDSGSVVVFASDEDSLSVITGFTIQNGSGTLNSERFGGGIYCYHTSPLITHNIIIGNTAFKGGAIYTENPGNAPALNISDNDIKWNSATAYGGGIYIDLGSAIIADNLISGNCACCGGGIASQFGWENNIVITGNKILNNQTGEGHGGGFWMDYGGTIIDFEYNLVSNNIGGGIVVLDYDFGSDIDLINNTICNNTNEGVHIVVGSFKAINNIISGNDIGFDAWAFNQYQINYNDVWNNPDGNYINCSPGIGNISSAPLFVNGIPYNYHLTLDSPCIDTGDPDSPFDPDGTIVDMGAYYYDQGVGIDNNEFQIPDLLLGNYPNPFNPSTTIFFELTAKDAENAKIEIFNLKGQKVKSLPVHQFTNTQVHQITWNGTDENSQQVSSGIYLYKLNVNGTDVAISKCVLLK